MPQAPKLQMTTAMALAQKLGLMSQIYNNRLANLLKAKDITYPQYEVLNFILRSGAQGTTIMKITEGVEILQPAVTKTSINLSNADCCLDVLTAQTSVSKTFPLHPKGPPLLAACRHH